MREWQCSQPTGLRSPAHEFHNRYISHSAYIFNINTRHQTTGLGPHTGDVKAVVFSRDGSSVATGCADTIVRLFETSTGRLKRSYKGHTGTVQSVAFAEDDQTLVSAGDDRTIRIWDVATGACRRIHLGHHDRISGVAISPDDQTIVSASGDGTVKLWDLHPPESPTAITVKQQLRALTFSADSQTLITGSAEGLLLSVAVLTGAEIETRSVGDKYTVLGLELSHDGSLAAVLKNNGYIEIHDVVRRKLLNAIGPFSGKVRATPFDTEGRRIAVLFWNQGLSIWDVFAKRESYFLAGHYDFARFTTHDELMVEAFGDRSLMIWNPNQGQTTTTLGLRWEGSCTCFSPDGALFAFAQWNKIKIMSYPDVERTVTLDGNAGNTTALAFSPDGKTLASGSDNGSIRLWDVATNEELMCSPGRRTRFA